MKTEIINRLPAVLRRVGLSRSTLYALIKAGEFKSPIPLGARAVGWLSSDIDAWIEQRAAARDLLAQAEGNDAC